ncbi:SDR family NAD(P)-dependent oxidoreductase [Bradyrhizobium sp. Ec3.3]|uniref:SDR family NAD(P)-dependent oxidoreductase n=1 Tax=Bradyrhizobium sp. Ec3.3 TaxID=189753 RepID=UPI0004183BCA|nr:SDR family oxidoreductase [Bradyrhizobium sp. Ec3.3]
MTGQVAGKVVLVSGAASGIGKAIAELLAQEGASVVATDLDESAGLQTVRDLVKQGHDATFLPQDVASEARWVEVVCEIDRRHGKLDALVSNAAIALEVSTLEMSLADWRKQIAVNLDSVFLSAKYSIPLMRRNAGGSIILISSTAGLFGVSRMAGYCATKGGVRSFAKALALECASTGIRVNSLHPGTTDTPIHAKMRGTDLDPAAAQQSVPLGRWGQAREIAQGVLYLASDVSSYVTGTELVIDGGWSAG